MANSWFRMYAEFAHDPKVQMLSEVDQRRFVMLLCLRCSNTHVTLHETLQKQDEMLHVTDEMLHVTNDETIAFELRINMEDWLRTKEVLMQKNLIDNNNLPTHWDKRQFISDSSTARQPLKEDWEKTPKQPKRENDRPSSEVWRLIRGRIFKRDDYTCHYCGERGVKLECDHVIPVSRGGHHGDENLVTACFKCNRSKRSKLVTEWRRE